MLRLKHIHIFVNLTENVRGLEMLTHKNIVLHIFLNLTENKRLWDQVSSKIPLCICRRQNFLKKKKSSTLTFKPLDYSYIFCLNNSSRHIFVNPKPTINLLDSFFSNSNIETFIWPQSRMTSTLPFSATQQTRHRISNWYKKLMNLLVCVLHFYKIFRAFLLPLFPSSKKC